MNTSFKINIKKRKIKFYGVGSTFKFTLIPNTSEYIIKAINSIAVSFVDKKDPGKSITTSKKIFNESVKDDTIEILNPHNTNLNALQCLR